jgi:hypothetical protein
MIKANFKSYGKFLVDFVYQWDLNQDLNINGLTVTSAPVIAFSNNVMKEAVIVQSRYENNAIVCEIPNALLQFDRDITAHLCTMINGQYKAYEKLIIPVVGRAKPANYLFTDNVPIITTESVIQQVETYLTELIDANVINYSLDDTGTGLNIEGGFRSDFNLYKTIPNQLANGVSVTSSFSCTESTDKYEISVIGNLEPTEQNTTV